MTRKDYIRLASALLASKPRPSATVGPIGNVVIAQWRTDCSAIADALGQESERFNRARFISACEGEEA